MTIAIDTAAPSLPLHPLDQLSLGKIVQIREDLLKAQAAGKTVYRLESGDPSFSIAPHVEEAIMLAMRAGKTHYIPNNGIPELRRAISRKVHQKNGLVGITPDDVFVTNGAMHALFVVFGALLCEGEEVIIPDPMWTEVAENIRLAGGVPIGVPLSGSDDFQYHPDRIRAAITKKTRAIFVNTPHNPTGAVLSAGTLREIVAIAKEHGLWIVSDEAYEDVCYEPHQHHSIGALAEEWAERVISIFSFSKSHAMSGLRTGYVVTRSRLLHDRIPKLLRCTINGVNSLAQWAALAAITGDGEYQKTMREEYRVRRDLIIGALSGIPGLSAFTPRGTFYAWVELDPSAYARWGVADADGLSSALAASGIGSAPGEAFGNTCENAIRFAFSCDTNMVRAGSAALRAWLERGTA